MLSMRRFGLVATIALFTSSAFGHEREELPVRAYERLTDLVDRMYLYGDTVTARAMLRGAASALSDSIPWLLVETEGNAVYLRHGAGAPIGSVSVAELHTLPQAVRALETLVLESGFPTETVDVRVTALSGMTRALDRYSKVLAGEQLSRFDVRLKGTLVGIGATFSFQDDTIVVTKLVTGAPAQKAGIREGDVLHRIEGVSTVNMPIREVSRRIRGELGSELELTFTRRGVALDVRIRRERVVVPNVSHRVLSGDVGYLKIDHFSQQTNDNMRKSLLALKELGALNAGLIVDLRDNTGGSMKQAARAVDHFVTEGLLLRTAGPDGGRVQNLQARMEATESDDDLLAPMVVLVDERTASGSEILAGALVQLQRAVLVGAATYGKGTVQKIYTLGTGARLKLTVARYILENELQITDAGLPPDAALAEVFLGKSGVSYDGWTQSEAGVDWNEVIPIVRERKGWREQVHEHGDVELELARRTILKAKKSTREHLLKVLENQAQSVKETQQAHLHDAYEAAGLDWQPPKERGATPYVPDVDGAVTLTPVPGEKNTYSVNVTLENLGQAPLHQALVYIGCDTSGTWDGIAVPLGRVAPNQKAKGSALVRLRSGVSARTDEVYASLRAFDTVPIVVARTPFSSLEDTVPALRMSAQLEGTGRDRTVLVTVQQDGTESLQGLEVSFEHPGDLRVELLEAAARIPELASGEKASTRLGVRMAENWEEESMPLKLVAESDTYRGALARWPVSLPLDGREITLQAPTIDTIGIPMSHSVGAFPFPLSVMDDRLLRYVTITVNGQKTAWIPGGEPQVSESVALELVAGPNRIRVKTEDDQGIQKTKTVWIWGEEPVSADAVNSDP